VLFNLINICTKAKKAKEGHSKVAKVDLWGTLINHILRIQAVEGKVQELLSKLKKCPRTRRTAQVITWSVLAADKNENPSIK
jgi:hypothetical protein